ncbi:MAG: PQQ-binding-like beta-propeller repeat protein [Verrucomicrobiota bacterium]
MGDPIGTLPLILKAILVALVSVGVAHADWRQFRGSGVDGQAPAGSVFPSSLDDSSIQWKVDLPGRGLSSPVIVGEKLFLTAGSGPSQARLHVFCFSTEDGSQIWERQFFATGRTMTHEKTSNAAPSPCTDGERVYALWSSNDLVCLDLDGNVQWIRGLMVDYPNASNSLGLATSPILVGDILVVQIEVDSQSIAVGIDKVTGTNLWKVEREKKANWSTPVPLGEHGGKQLVALQGSAGVTAVDAATGETVWTHGEGASTIPSGVYRDGVFYAVSNGITAIDVVNSAPGETPKVLWEASTMRPKTPSPILLDDRIVIVAGDVFTCASLEDGERLWKSRGEGGTITGSVIAAGNRLCAVSEREGIVQIIDPTGDEGKVTAKLKLGDLIQCTPAYADGAIYVRSDKMLWKIGG